MNFFAMFTLKNERACLRLPISIRPLRSLKFTFDSERTGMARVGSLRFSAALITMSATLTSFFSTTVGLCAFLAMRSLPLLLPRGGLRLRGPLRFRLRPRLYRRHHDRLRGGRRAVRRAVGRHHRHLALDALGRDDDRVWQALGAAVAILPEQLLGPLSAGDLPGHRQQLI